MPSQLRYPFGDWPLSVFSSRDCHLHSHNQSSGDKLSKFLLFCPSLSIPMFQSRSSWGAARPGQSVEGPPLPFFWTQDPCDKARKLLSLVVAAWPELTGDPGPHGSVEPRVPAAHPWAAHFLYPRVGFDIHLCSAVACLIPAFTPGF